MLRRNDPFMREVIETAARNYAREQMGDDAYMDAVIRFIGDTDEQLSAQQYYNITARLSTIDAIIAMQEGIERRRKRLFDLARWCDDGGPERKFGDGSRR